MTISILGPEIGALPDLVMWVPGKAQTAGSKRGFVNPNTGGVIITESAKGNAKIAKKTWRGDLKDAGMHARAEQWGLSAPTDVAIDARFVFVRARSSDQKRSGKFAGMVQEWALRLRPVKRPDVLKLARAAEDALTGVLWLDDSQIVDERLHKVFGDQVGLDPRAEGLLLVVRQAGEYVGPMVGGPVLANLNAAVLTTG